MGDSRTVLEGGCLCEAVRYRFTGPPITFYACHCTDCQRQSGSAFGLSMIVARTAIEITKGTPRTFAATLPDGREIAGKFCDRCATRLWGEPSRYPQILTLRPGTLDLPGAYAPAAQLWTRSAQRWLAMPEGVHFETQPHDPLEVVRVWQQRHPA